MEELVTTIYLIGGVALAIGFTAMCAEGVLSLLPAAGDKNPQTDP